MTLIIGTLLPLLFSSILGSNDKVKYYTEIVEHGMQKAANFKYPTNAYSYEPKENEIQSNTFLSNPFNGT